MLQCKGRMSKEKQKLWLFFMILLYVTVAIVGFCMVYFIKTEFFPSQNQISLTNSPTTAVITPVPPGWKMYTNEDDNLGFFYPSTDTLGTKSYEFGVTNLLLKDAKGNTDFQILLMPQTLAMAVGQDFSSYLAMPNNKTQTIKSPLTKENATEKFTKISNRTVGGNQAIDYQSLASNAKPGTQPEIGTFIQAGNNLVLISTNKNNKNKLEALLNSFRYPL